MPTTLGWLPIESEIITNHARIKNLPNRHQQEGEGSAERMSGCYLCDTGRMGIPFARDAIQNAVSTPFVPTPFPLNVAELPNTKL